MVAAVKERMDAYDCYSATARIVEFVDALSNRYLRRSRPRFWKGGLDDDKRGVWIANDNNYPFDVSREQGKQDDEEFMILNVPDLLNAK